MDFTTRPISDRTPFTGEHEASRFAVTYGQVIDLLESELGKLDATNIVMELDVTEGDLRLDGRVRANARAASPAVRIAFDSNQGPITMATDTFVRGAPTVYVGHGSSRAVRRSMEQDWQHNLYAIAKSLEAMRMVTRYGVIKRGEQYVGLKQLNAGRAMPASHMTASDARSILADYLTASRGGTIRTYPQDVESAIKSGLWSGYRKPLLRSIHPDLNDGDHTRWDKAREACAVLGVEL